MIAVSLDCEQENRSRLAEAGCEVWVSDKATHNERIKDLLSELGSRQMTNVLVEGGSGLLGALFEIGEIDEVHAFIAAKLVGGQHAISPIGGSGKELMSEANEFNVIACEQFGNDIHVVSRKSR